MPDREVDAMLWAKLEPLAKGTEAEKVEFLREALPNYRKLPPEADAVILSLAKRDQPESVRICLAQQVAKKYNISFGIYSDVLEALHGDPTPEVSEVVNVEEDRLRALVKPLSDYAVQLTTSVVETMKQLAAMNVSLPKIELPKIALPDVSSFASSQQYLGTISGVVSASEELARGLSVLSPGYYPPALFTEIPKVEQGEESRNPLLERLEQCPRGREGWRQYQDICKEILEFLFVPPLPPPFEQDRTVNGLHIRDFILDIPYNAGGFWAEVHITHKASAVIVDAKNFLEPLPPEEMVLNGKYYGESKCGLFGVIFCPAGLSDSARSEQARLWRDEHKMIVCVDNVDVAKMILLKAAEKEPELVLDEKRRELRRSIE